MQKVSNIIPYFKSELRGFNREREIVSWGYIVMHFLLGYTRSDCIVHADRNISVKISNQIKTIVRQLKSKKPIHYILGEIQFFGLTFKVNENVLIPRSETEELVKWILECSFQSVLDIGTGSGCIAISLAKNSSAQVSALDISSSALEVAQHNAKINDVDIKFLTFDVFTSKFNNKYDLIVSNPPYVLEKEKRSIDPNVLEYEPHLALFVPNNNPLKFYERIITLASKSLNEGGVLFFEINEKYGQKISTSLQRAGFVDIELKKDINDKDRMLKAIWK